MFQFSCWGILQVLLGTFATHCFVHDAKPVASKQATDSWLRLNKSQSVVDQTSNEILVGNCCRWRIDCSSLHVNSQFSCRRASAGRIHSGSLQVGILFNANKEMTGSIGNLVPGPVSTFGLVP